MTNNATPVSSKIKIINCSAQYEYMGNYEKGINKLLRCYRNRKMLLGIVSEEEGIMCRCSVMSYFLWEGELVNPNYQDTLENHKITEKVL